MTTSPMPINVSSTVTNGSEETSTPHNPIPCTPPEPIAVVGIGCHLPGGVQTPSDLWDLLSQKRSGYRDFTPSRINIDGYYHPNPQRPGSVPSKGAYLLDEDPRLFDHAFFGISAAEVYTMDPTHRKMLEVTYAAFESAGEPWDKFSGSRTGVFVGNFNNDHHLLQTYDIDFAPAYISTGVSSSILSNRINHVFNLRGPSLTVDTACSSSMYALHLAVLALRNNDCDAAIVGGSNLIQSPEMQRLMTTLGALSPTSTCHTFDASADGYARGEGFGALYLKRYSTAVENNDTVRALVRGTGLNANGRTAGITHPSVDGQEALIRHTYEKAGLETRYTGYVEAHGTGTFVGDPVEVAAIGRVFGRESPLLVGSIKSNLGHAEAASGVSGIIKSILALEKGVIPPTIGVRNLNPNINFTNPRVQVVTEPTPWPKGTLKRCSINSFGYGGANAHCILDHPDVLHTSLPRLSNGTVENGSHSPLQPLNGALDSSNITTNGSHATTTPNTHRLVLLPFSAHDSTALHANISALQDCIAELPLADVAYTLAERRSRFLVRTTRIVSPDSASTDLGVSQHEPVSVTSGQIPRLGFIFTGQGAQYAKMGRELLEFSQFRSSIQQQDKVLQKLSNQPTWRLVDVLAGDVNVSMHDPEISQTICTALQMGMVDLLGSWNVDPQVVAGHSSGEIAAAYAAGHLSLPEAIVTAYCRGQAIVRNEKKGRMMAVGLSQDAARSLLEESVPGAKTCPGETVKIAAVNSPESVTLSGDEDTITELQQRLTASGVFTRILQTGGNAYHSHHMIPVGREYEELLTQALLQTDISDETQQHTRRSLDCEWVSTVNPYKKTSDKTARADPAYWSANLTSPVHFAQAVEEMLTNHAKKKPDILIEIGPHSALQSPLKQIMTSLQGRDGVGSTPQYLPSLKRHEDGLKNLLELAGHLFCLKHSVRVSAVNSNATTVRDDGSVVYASGSLCTDLPPYQYTYGPVIYHSTRIGQEIKQRPFLRHDTLGAMQAGCSLTHPTWRNILRVKDVPWLGDHKLSPNPVFPGAGYPCLAIEAMTQWLSQTNKTTLPSSPPCFKLRNIHIKSAMRLPDDDSGLEIILGLCRSKGNPTWCEFQISSLNEADQTWTEHASGLISVVASNNGPSMQAAADVHNLRDIDVREWYAKFTEFGLDYGKAFQGLAGVQCNARRNFARARVDFDTTHAQFPAGPESAYTMHPVALDTCFQLGCIAAYGGQSQLVRHVYVPVYIEEMTVWPDTTESEPWGIADTEGRHKGLRGGLVSIQLRTRSGRERVEVKNMRCVAYDGRDTTTTTNAMPPEENEYTRLVWIPDIALLSNFDAGTLFRPRSAPSNMAAATFVDIEKVTTYMLVHIAQEYASSANLAVTEPHLQHFLAWARRAATDDTALQFAAEARALPSATRLAAINELSGPLEPQIIDIRHTKRLFDNMAAILTGQTSALELARRDDLLTELYTTSIGIAGAYTQLTHLLDLAAHANPSISILEIGAGTGGATRVALRCLGGDTRTKRYQTYTFTDISPAFFAAAQAEFASFSDVKYQALDIARDPTAQGFEPAGYDLVIASQCLHATPDITTTLTHVKTLLKPGGKLLLIEATHPVIGHGLAFGTFPGFWFDNGGGDEEEPRFPFHGHDVWDRSLKKAGFSGIDIELADYEDPFHIASTMLATAAGVNNDIVLPPAPPRLSDEPVSIIYHHTPSSFHTALSAELRRLNKTPQLVKLEDATASTSTRAIFTVELEGTTLVDFPEADFTRLKTLALSISSLLYVTRGGVVRAEDPKSAVATGFIRQLITERPESRFGIIHLSSSSSSPNFQNEATAIALHESRIRASSSAAAAESELALDAAAGIAHIPRLIFDAALNAQFRAMYSPSHATVPLPITQQPETPVVAAFATPGVLGSVYFTRDESFAAPLPPDHVELASRATGLNWKNLGVATGKIDMDELSFEAAGIVLRCGSAVTRFKPGDEVYGFAWGKFGTVTRVPACILQPAVPGISMTEMASVPVVCCTAVYALTHLARVRAHERILIQSASGGVGLAAIQLAQHLQADIFATVGSDEKAQFLVDTYGIPRCRIFSSRSEADLGEMMAATDGRGFDVVLSLSTGNMMHETWRCIAPRGRFIDVGRLDAMDASTMAMEVFTRNATFSSFDIYTMYVQDREFCASLMQEVDALLRTHVLRPITPIRTFSIADLDKALLYFSRGKHIGKIVVTYDDPNAIVKMRPSLPTAHFDPSAQYLIFGGLGAIGRSIAQWMAERGARHISVCSRSGEPSAEDKFWLQDLPAGQEIQFVRCDVTSRADIDGVVAAARGREIKGIIHAAVTFHDVNFEGLSYEQWRQGLSAKVKGTVLLHEASLEHGLPLDFFITTSSIQAIMALPAGTSYCAANNFQDQFARYRRSLGLPACSIALGPITEIGGLGVAAMTMTSHFRRNCLYTTGELGLLRLMEGAFLPPPESTADGDDTWKAYDPFAEAQLVTCLDPMKLATIAEQSRQDTTLAPRWHSDNKYSHVLRAMLDQLSTRSLPPQAKVETASDLLLEVDEALKQDGDASGVGKAVSIVAGAIVQRTAAILVVPKETVDPEKSIAHYGIDSAVAVELRSWMVSSFGYNIPLLKLLDESVTMNGLGESIVNDIVNRKKQAS